MLKWMILSFTAIHTLQIATKTVGVLASSVSAFKCN